MTGGFVIQQRLNRHGGGSLGVLAGGLVAATLEALHSRPLYTEPLERGAVREFRLGRLLDLESIGQPSL